MKKNINLAIVGHIDHGKSTFIGRLLYDSGYMKKYDIVALQQEEGNELDFSHFLDIYKEERENSMTMDTTKRFFETNNYQYTIIDSPGHKEFIKNMLSGVSEAQYAIAIVSCLDSERIQEQTKRHLALLNLLGINLIAIAINKMELVGYDEERFYSLVNELKQFLAYINYDISDISFIPVSAKLGENICARAKNLPWYKGPTIIECLDSKVKPAISPVSKPLRISVQHTNLQDSIIFGRIETGKLNLGDIIIFEPSHVQGIVKSISVLGKQAKEAFAGDSIGISFETSNLSIIKRGDVGGNLDNCPKAYDQAIVELILPFDAKLKVGEELLFRLGTVETPVVISEIIKKIRSEDLSFIEDSPLSLNEGEIGILKLTFREPQVIEKYSDIRELGRFLLMANRKVLPGIIIQTSSSTFISPKLVCGVSPLTINHLSGLVKQRRVAMLRANGAFSLPDFKKLKSYELPIILDIPGNRKKTRTSDLSDDEIIEIAIKENLDYVALSYVSSDDWIKKVRENILSKMSSLKIIAKIETKEALQNINSIVEASDMLLIDRGDLGSDVGYEKVPFYQEKIINISKRSNKPVLVATELAMSTIDSSRPTYADTAQIYNLLRQGVDYFVLAEETTRNEDPLASVKQINQILDFAEACF